MDIPEFYCLWNYFPGFFLNYVYIYLNLNINFR